jgi:hypothetical protein
LQRDAEQAVENGQGVERQVDTHRPELPADLKGILRLIQERVSDPPEIPGERGVVDAVAGHVADEV